MELQVTTLDGKADGSVTLKDEIFGLEVRQDILHRMVALRPVVQVGEDDPPADTIADVHHTEKAVDFLRLTENRFGTPLIAVGVGQR